MYHASIDPDMPLDEAERGLLESLRDSYVVSSTGERMSTRWRSGALDTDMIAHLTRIAPDHVRCDDLQIRGVKRSGLKSGREGLVHRIAGRGSLRANPDGSVSWRDTGKSEWRPASMQALARDYDADHVVWAWLRRHDITRPSPSGPTQSAEARRASGRVRVEVWLTSEEHEALERRRRGRSVRDTIGALLLGG